MKRVARAEHPIADSYWVEPGSLLAGEYPGAHTDAAAQEKLCRLLDVGVRQFIDLTEKGEYNLRPYRSLVQQLAAARGLQVAHTRLSIADMGTPAPAHMLAILDTIDAALAADRPVYVHCFAGIGRTGTVVGCYLARHGLNPESALAAIAQRRQGTPGGWRRSPETDEQRRFVLAWHERP